jgi:hypothetical protein
MEDLLQSHDCLLPLPRRENFYQYRSRKRDLETPIGPIRCSLNKEQKQSIHFVMDMQ